MLRVFRSRWRNHWHVYEVDTGGKVWLATFARKEAAFAWVQEGYDREAEELTGWANSKVN